MPITRRRCCRSTCSADRSFALSAATAVCSFAVQGLAFVSLPFYFEDRTARSQVETGFFMTPWPLVVAIMAPIGGRLSDRYPAGILGGVGMVLLAIGMVLLATLRPNRLSPTSSWRMAICGLGFGFFQTPNMKALMSSSPPHRSGSASASSPPARLTGQTIGAALAALCFAVGRSRRRHGGAGARRGICGTWSRDELFTPRGRSITEHMTAMRMSKPAPTIGATLRRLGFSPPRFCC